MAPSSESPSTQPPSSHPRGRISRAADILPTPLSSQRRYAAYVRGRARFWDAFSHGYYARLNTPGTDLECGFYALILSARWQFPEGVRVPTLKELRGVWREEFGGEGGWLRADEVAAVFNRWGSRYLSGVGGAEGGSWRCQMGWVTDGGVEGDEFGWPVMMNTPDVETGEVGEDILRVWVWNDGLSLAGGVGHFEGARGLTGEEREGVMKVEGEEREAGEQNG
ncbi:hypothetical protein C8A05DRAFT_16536 [Staphylotrichum tortipilum]|uniref:Uncharacterized protein n=1 Tax=Staphylotrichum tortipilum TaxID=2831512 RepID=A0AAN6MI21_9PEZI|nr:hypothetical protein C8A05DRAFT_16536 [Staphylotrichum longicolle]